MPDESELDYVKVNDTSLAKAEERNRETNEKGMQIHTTTDSSTNLGWLTYVYQNSFPILRNQTEALSMEILCKTNAFPDWII